ncbi:MAG TPA: aminotransferase class V-fold PLP-dependent enzyme [Thermoanaerobaculia bacterium]|nr:aminotransferase class V-fold PLP-dependent enzyme [Thermoanaerobaculia bacterium]
MTGSETSGGPVGDEDRLVEGWRRDTPLVATGRVHLNNAGASPMPRPVVDRVVEHLRLEAEMGGYEAAAACAEEIASVRGEVARLVGVRERNVALVESTTAGYAQALSAFDFGPGDVIVTTRNDYVSNQLMFLSLVRRRGVEVQRADDLPGGGVDPESVRSLLRRRRPALVALTLVPTGSGLVQPGAAVGELCATHGVPYLVDACQAVGQLVVDAGELRCDFLCASARKFLRGPRGVGFMTVSDSALGSGLVPLFPDLHGATWTTPESFEPVPDARRFENWEFPYALVLGLGAAIRYALAAGIGCTTARAARLAALARLRLGELDGVRVLDRGDRLGAIVAVELLGADARSGLLALRERGIQTSALERSGALLELDDRGARSALRISPHYFNTEGEIDRLVRELAKWLATQGRV